jgi:multiple sugar transport system substrate-binding protein
MGGDLGRAAHGLARAASPAYAQVQNEHVWQTAWAEIMKDGVALQAAAEKAFKRVEEIFTKYPIA